jgi:hypothetical protein
LAALLGEGDVAVQVALEEMRAGLPFSSAGSGFGQLAPAAVV